MQTSVTLPVDIQSPIYGTWSQIVCLFAHIYSADDARTLARPRPYTYLPQIGPEGAGLVRVT